MHLNVIEKTVYGYHIATATSDWKLLIHEDEPTLLILMLSQALVRIFLNEIHLNVVKSLPSCEYDINT